MKKETKKVLKDIAINTILTAGCSLATGLIMYCLGVKAGVSGLADELIQQCEFNSKVSDPQNHLCMIFESEDRKLKGQMYSFHAERIKF